MPILRDAPLVDTWLAFDGTVIGEVTIPHVVSCHIIYISRRMEQGI